MAAYVLAQGVATSLLVVIIIIVVI